MDWVEFGQAVGTVLMSLGAAGGLLVGSAKWIGGLMAKTYVEQVKHDLRRETESYRTRLRKSEFLFEKEFEAASAFIDMRRRLWPRMRHPEEDWGEAVGQFGKRLEEVEDEMRRYLSGHGAALQEPVLEMVREALNQAEYGKFEFDEFGPARSIAERVLDGLKEIEAELLRYSGRFGRSPVRSSVRVEWLVAGTS